MPSEKRVFDLEAITRRRHQSHARERRKSVGKASEKRRKNDGPRLFNRRWEARERDRRQSGEATTKSARFHSLSHANASIWWLQTAPPFVAVGNRAGGASRRTRRTGGLPVELTVNGSRRCTLGNRRTFRRYFSIFTDQIIIMIIIIIIRSLSVIEFCYLFSKFVQRA